MELKGNIFEFQKTLSIKIQNVLFTEIVQFKLIFNIKIKCRPYIKAFFMQKDISPQNRSTGTSFQHQCTSAYFMPILSNILPIQPILFCH